MSSRYSTDHIAEDYNTDITCNIEKSAFYGKVGIVIQSTLVISTSVISNNRLSRRENLVLVLTEI